MRISFSRSSSVSSARSAQARSASFGGRAIRQGQVPPQRQAVLQRLFSSLKPRLPVLSRGSLAAQDPPSGNNGKDDGRGLAAQMLRPGAGVNKTELLKMAQTTCVTCDDTMDAAKAYKDQFHDSFTTAVHQMSDLQLRMACKRMSGDDIRGITAALYEEAAKPATTLIEQARQKEVQTLANQLSLCVADLFVEASDRGLSFEGSYLPEMPQDPQAATRLRAEAQQIGDDMATGITVTKGNFPPTVMTKIQGDFDKLTSEAESVSMPRDATKPKGEKLCGAFIFFKDFNRQRVYTENGKTLLAQYKEKHGSPGLLKDKECGQISDFFVNYCNGDMNQARRLGSVLTQDGLAVAYIALTRNTQLMNSPYPGQVLDTVNCATDHDPHLTRADNGDITVDWKVRMAPHGTTDPNLDSFPLDNRKSSIKFNLKFTIPARADAPAEFSKADYESTLKTGFPSGLGGSFDELPRSYAGQMPGIIRG